MVVCGLPCSGKTRATRLLAEHLTAQDKTVMCVSDDDFNIDRNNVYADSKHEKELRSNLKFEVQKNLTTNNVVILDSLNYIKGYRYELFCLAKGARTTYCVVYANTDAIQAAEYNADVQHYSAEIYQALVNRFEAPIGTNRWDSPLFITSNHVDLNVSEIYDALFSMKALKPNHSTETVPLASGDYLQDLEKSLQSVISAVMSSQKTCVPGDEITVPGAVEKLKLNKVCTVAELGRYKRQFVTFTKTRGIDKNANIVNLFVQYLNKNEM